MASSDPTSTESCAAHQPYVPDHVALPEFTWLPVLMGAVLGIVFGASSLYLVLKVGITVSASIPVAVLSITLFRAFSNVFGIRRATILENNIVQTTGSAGESIAFGVGVTMPAVMILGFDLEITRVMVVSILGGVLGILMMIPLRRAFIVKQHGKLVYPEGTACADVLVVGETGGASAKTVFLGFGIAFVYQFLAGGLKLWKDVVSRCLDWFQGATPSLEANPALLGVGYIIGTRIASIMVGGGILQAFVLVPLIRFFGEGLSGPLGPGTGTIASMDAETIYKTYVRYIGAGAVAAGGIIGLCRAMPLIVSSIVSGMRDMRASLGGAGGVRRTDRDLPLKAVLFGTLLLVLAIWLFLDLDPQTGGDSIAAAFAWQRLLVNLAASTLIVVFGFLFVTVSSRLTGEIGSSSNPISGMTIATLLLTCLIFLMLDWTSAPYRLLALSVAAIVCIAASNGGTTSQDLKTGYLVGATPKWQQWAIVVGSVSSSVVIGAVLLAMNQSSTVYSTKNLPELKQPLDVPWLVANCKVEHAPNDDTPYYAWHAPNGNPQGVPAAKYFISQDGKRLRYLVDPGISGRLSRQDDGTEVRKYNPPQAELFALITNGILSRKLPWTLVLLGAAIAVVVELCGVSSLAFAVGVYLPLSSSAPIFAGGIVRYLVEHWGKKPDAPAATEVESEMSPGSLLSTGYIAGGTIAGVLIAFLNFNDTIVNTLATWQYRTATVSSADYSFIPSGTECVFDNQCRAMANRELGATASGKQIKRLAAEIRDLNESQLYNYVRVAKGMKLHLPKSQQHITTADATLGQLAQQTLHGDVKASLLFDLNADQLQLPRALPSDAKMKIPQGNATAIVTFALLAVVLVVVGRGWLLKKSEKEQQDKELPR
jgi:putative OPT family oligopeptide transporter